MTYVNLGCGSRHHPSWINIDLVSNDPGVIAHDLSIGIPLKDESCNVVYHSHVLEHLNRHDALFLLQECSRVLVVGGIIRVVVPDLEQVCRLYLDKLEAVLGGDTQSEVDYEWIMLELLDQSVRETGGGEMRNYLLNDQIANTDFVIGRIGDIGREIISTKHQERLSGEHQKRKLSAYLAHFHLRVRGIGRAIGERVLDEKLLRAIRVARFRLKGEIHLWMYDRYSLSKLLLQAGFSDVRIQTAVRSQIPNWNDYGLDINSEGSICKPNSLFMEAKKFEFSDQT